MSPLSLGYSSVRWVIFVHQVLPLSFGSYLSPMDHSYLLSYISLLDHSCHFFLLGHSCCGSFHCPVGSFLYNLADFFVLLLSPLGSSPFHWVFIPSFLSPLAYSFLLSCIPMSFRYSSALCVIFLCAYSSVH